jgi:hypothetical protein
MNLAAGIERVYPQTHRDGPRRRTADSEPRFLIGFGHFHHGQSGLRHCVGGHEQASCRAGRPWCSSQIQPSVQWQTRPVSSLP